MLTILLTLDFDDTDIVSKLLPFLSNSMDTLDICLESKRVGILLNNTLKNIIIKSKTQGTRIRLLTDINMENLPHCKELSYILDNESFHCLSDLKNSFAINESQYVVIFDSENNGLGKESPLSPFHIRVTSIDNIEIVNQQHNVFDFLWDRSMSAGKVIKILDRQKLQETEEEKEFLEVITDHNEASETFVNLAKSVRYEALLLLSNAKAMIREQKIGVLQELVNASNRGAEVKIVSPLDAENADIVIWLSKNAPNIKILDKDPTSITIFIVDNERFFKAELKQEDENLFPLAIGFVVYSNSKPTVSAFKSFFNLFWKQSNLNEKLIKVNEEIRKANEKLKKTDQAKDEFLNIAAHELRNPIQIIATNADLLQRQLLNRGIIKDKGTDNDDRFGELLFAISRNTDKMIRLSTVLLDIGRIEFGTFKLDLEDNVNLENLILELVEDMNQKYHLNTVSILYNSKVTMEETVVRCDRTRITQVLINLLENAIRFTKDGGITISIDKNTTTPMPNPNSQIQLITRIKDTGFGIDEQIKSRLFEKFASKSTNGTGLGLYLSKNIIEAHGGKIWAKNNEDGKGSTFSFSLPLMGRYDEHGS